MGMTPALGGRSSQVCIINTCAVTREAARKSRQMVRKLMEKNPGAIIYAVGCAAQMADTALGNLPDNVVMVDNSRKDELDGIIAKDLGLSYPGSCCPRPVPDGGRVRAYLKVQDGCDSFCSYCIIPHLRGRSRSRKSGEILDEMLRLEAAGFKEVVITGIHLGDYGNGIPGDYPLWRLIDFLMKNTAIPRVRLSSIEPMDFSFELLNLFARHPRLCPHLHLPLQHGSNRILKTMNRRYTREDYDRILQEAHLRIPGINITTDVMAGFPGEEEEDFLKTYNYIKDAPIFGLHVFPFSPRQGTVASGLEGKVPRHIKKDRVRKLTDLGKKKKEQALESYPGTTRQVLVEARDADGFLSGYTRCYARVRMTGGDGIRGRLVKVKIIKRQGELLYGENPEPLCTG